MLDAGITDPENNAGKEFCTEHCPYPDCVLFGTKHYRDKIMDRKGIITRLHKKGRTPKEIAETLGISVRIVYRNLK